MKFMNNHYGQSMIFKHARHFAEPINADGAGDGIDGSGGGSDGSSSDNPADGANGDNDGELELLKAQLAKAQAEAERQKYANDKLSKANKDLTSKMRQSMSDEQRKQEDQEAIVAELEELRKQVRVGNYTTRLIEVGMSKEEATDLANIIPSMDDADTEFFFGKLSAFIDGVKKTAGTEAVQKLIKDRPEINAGNGDKKSTVAEDKAVAIAKTRSSNSGGGNIADYYKR